jgi:hypothetical protein
MKNQEESSNLHGVYTLCPKKKMEIRFYSEGGMLGTRGGGCLFEQGGLKKASLIR